VDTAAVCAVALGVVWLSPGSWLARRSFAQGMLRYARRERPESVVALR
jgi:hypothetical protein